MKGVLAQTGQHGPVCEDFKFYSRETGEVYFMLSRKFALANLHGNETNLVIDKLGVAVADGCSAARAMLRYQFVRYNTLTPLR